MEHEHQENDIERSIRERHPDGIGLEDERHRRIAIAVVDQIAERGTDAGPVAEPSGHESRSRSEVEHALPRPKIRGDAAPLFVLPQEHAINSSGSAESDRLRRYPGPTRIILASPG